MRQRQSSTNLCERRLIRKLSIRAFFWAVVRKIPCRNGWAAARRGSMKPHTPKSLLLRFDAAAPILHRIVRATAHSKALIKIPWRNGFATLNLSCHEFGFDVLGARGEVRKERKKWDNIVVTKISGCCNSEIEKEWFHSGFGYKYPGRIFPGQNNKIVNYPKHVKLGLHNVDFVQLWEYICG